MWFKLILGILLLINYAQPAVIQRNSAIKTPWTLLQSLMATKYIRNFNGTWISDDEFYYTAADSSIHKYNVAENIDTIFVPPAILDVYTSGSSFVLSPDNTQILVKYNVEEVFRHSNVANYDIVDLNTRSIIKVFDGKKLQYCNWSPVNDRLAFVFENNVYIRFENGEELRITTEGVEGIIYNGVPDWVYEEEVLASGSALWWSPDGLKLAVATFDDTNVRTFKYFIYGSTDEDNQYPKEVDLKYPKTGTPNPVVGLRLFDLSDQTAIKSKTLTAPTDIVSADHILQDVVWASKDSILVVWLNRRQNIASLQLCDKSACREVKRINEPDGWVTIQSFKCLSSGNNCLFLYWIGNWYQIWNLDLTTGENIWSSRGDFTVINLYGYDEVNNKLYYRATLKGEPATFHVFSNDDCLSCQLKDIDGVPCTTARASFSKQFSYYVLSCNGPTPTYATIFNTKTNSEVKVWEENEIFRNLAAEKLQTEIINMNVTLADGSIGYAQLRLPAYFDKSKKYPMIVVVYGGPNSLRVSNSFELGFPAFVTTTREVIYATIDGRGTGNKGKDVLFSVNNKLGHYEVEDQIYVTQQLTEKLGYIDAKRIAIWGWSYGGYMTAKTLSNDTNKVFQCGVSVAPVTSWLYYDTIYTERYMGLLESKSDFAKYKESSVLDNVENFRSHDFLLMHGTGDDNVHFQQTLMLAKALQREDILFEEMTYADENHSIENYLPHLYSTMDQFFINCLNLDTSEKAFL